MANIALKSILTQILNDRIKFDEAEARLAELQDDSVEPASYHNLTSVLIKFINNRRYDLVKVLLEKIKVYYFDTLLDKPEDKEQHGIANNYKNLRHYVISEIFKTVPIKEDYKQDTFISIITKFKLADIDYLQLLVNVPEDKQDVIELAARKILGESTIDIRKIIPYMVEYFKQPASNKDLTAFLQLLASLKAIKLINDTDLTHLVEDFVLNEQQAVKQLSLDSAFVHAFIHLIPTRDQSEVGQNSNTSYLDLVKEVTQRFIGLSNKELSTWVRNNLAEFMAWLPHDKKAEYFSNRNFLTKLFSKSVAPDTIKGVLDVLLKGTTLEPSQIVSTLAAYKDKDHGHVGLKWAIENLPLADVGINLVNEIQALLIQQKFEECKELYQTLIGRLDEAASNEAIWEDHSDEFAEVFSKLIEQIRGYTQANNKTKTAEVRLTLLNQVLTDGKGTNKLFAQTAILDIWLRALLAQTSEIVAENKNTKGCKVFYQEFINRLDTALKSAESSVEDKDMLAFYFNTMVKQICETSPKQKTFPTELRLSLLEEVLESCRNTALFQHEDILSFWLNALLAQNRTEDFKDQQKLDKLNSLFESSVDLARQQGVADQQICKICVDEFAWQINNRAEIKKGKGSADFSHSAYAVKLFGLLGLVNYIAVRREDKQQNIKDHSGSILKHAKSTLKSIAVSDKKHQKNKQVRMEALATVLNAYITKIQADSEGKLVANQLHQLINQACNKFSKKGQSSQFSDALKAFGTWLDKHEHHNPEAALQELKTFFALLGELNMQPGSGVKVFLDLKEVQNMLGKLNPNSATTEQQLEETTIANEEVSTSHSESSPTESGLPGADFELAEQAENFQEEIPTEDYVLYWDGKSENWFTPEDFIEELAGLAKTNVEQLRNTNVHMAINDDPEVYLGTIESVLSSRDITKSNQCEPMLQSWLAEYKALEVTNTVTNDRRVSTSLANDETTVNPDLEEPMQVSAEQNQQVEATSNIQVNTPPPPPPLPAASFFAPKKAKQQALAGEPSPSNNNAAREQRSAPSSNLHQTLFSEIAKRREALTDSDSSDDESQASDRFSMR